MKVSSESEPLEQLSDQDLVRMVKKNPETFGYLMERYEEPLFRYLIRFTGWAKEEVEDILQEAFIKAYRHINDYDPNMKFSAWIYRITHNQAVDVLRRQNRSPIQTSWSLEDVARLVASSENTEEQFFKQEQIASLQEAINTLPRRYREVLVLRFLEEKTYEEIMDILKIPKGSVATLIRRGKALLLSNLTQ